MSMGKNGTGHHSRTARGGGRSAYNDAPQLALSIYRFISRDNFILFYVICRPDYPSFVSTIIRFSVGFFFFCYLQIIRILLSVVYEVSGVALRTGLDLDLPVRVNSDGPNRFRLKTHAKTRPVLPTCPVLYEIGPTGDTRATDRVVDSGAGDNGKTIITTAAWSATITIAL